MKSFPIPENEAARLKSLRELGIETLQLEHEYNNLAQLVSDIADCDISFICIVEEHEVIIKAACGAPCGVLDRNLAICAHTIMQDEIFVVEDLLSDDKFYNNTLIREIGVRFYAGIPFFTPDGHVIGAVCLLDREPRKVTESKRRALKAAATQVTSLLAMKLISKKVEEDADGKHRLTRMALQRNLKKHHEEQVMLGHELHENFAQTLAACMTYLDLSNGNPDLTAMVNMKTKDMISDMFDKVRELSMQINPTANLSVANADRFKQLCYELGKRGNMQIRFDHFGHLDLIMPAQLIGLYRILLDQVESYSYFNKFSGSVQVQLGVEECIELQIWSDGDTIETKNKERLSLFATIRERGRMHGGTVKVDHHKDGALRLYCRIPLNIGSAE